MHRERKCENFPDSRLWCPKSFQTPNPETSQNFCKLPRVFANLQKCWKLSWVFKNFAVSTNFPECMETFQCPNFPEAFHSARKLSRVFRNNPVPNFSSSNVWKFFRVPRSFSGCPETFKKIAIFSHISYDQLQKKIGLQKLSIKQCLNTWEVFLTLPMHYNFFF